MIWSERGIVSNLRLSALSACVAALGLIAVDTAHAEAVAPPKYAITERWPLAGTGKWDYLLAEPAHHRLYVSRESRVQVLDTRTGKLDGEIPNTPGVHGIAVAPDLGYGFTSNGRANSVTVFDLVSLKVIGDINISGAGPDAIIYEPRLKRVYTFNGHDNSMTVIDAATRKELQTISLPGKPEFATSDDAHLYVNIEDKNSVAVVDSQTGRISALWSLSPCEEPTGLAIDRRHERLFSVCHNQLMIVTDAKTGRQVATVPIGAHVDAVAFDPASNLAFSSNGDSANVTVVSESTPDLFRRIDSVATEHGSKTMALDVVSHRLFVPALIAGSLQILVLTPAPEPAAGKGAR